MADSLERSSPCKINLLLNVLCKRADGFHELETVMQRVELCDQLRFSRGGHGAGVELTCSDPTLPVDARNLVHRAATAFLERAGLSEAVRIHLEKRIPQAAGLGGGSGNAATALLALNELFGQPLPADQLTAIATSLGSDVPFFLQAGPALGLGRGERITPLEPFRALRNTAVLLIHPGFGVSTAWAYQELGRYPAATAGQPGRAGRLIELLQTDDPAAAGAGLYNSLEAPVLEKYPLLVVCQEFLRSHGAIGALMSGSGSTTFAIVRDEADARRLEQQVREKFGSCWTAVVPL